MVRPTDNNAKCYLGNQFHWRPSSAFRPALSPPPALRLINQEIIKFLSTFDRRNKPARSCPTACPSLTRTTTIFRWDFPSFQCAFAPNSSTCANQGKHLQLLFNLGPTLMKGFVNPLLQVHECFNGHSR